MKSQIISATALAVSLLACAQETPGTHHNATQNPAAMATQTHPARIMVQFKNPSTIDAPGFAQRLQTLTHAPARYLAAVSADTYVYLLHTQPGQSPAQMLQQLNAMPEVARAEFDQKTKAP